ncbi:hypothetical protein AAG570_002857 [Ranatra chinensis]|uniref:Uncharacterized protein n=1 Tax=Ranatra chinensis TaxID=642074 RepID=A0ABD0Y5P5_9HEMI
MVISRNWFGPTDSERETTDYGKYTFSHNETSYFGMSKRTASSRLSLLDIKKIRTQPISRSNITEDKPDEFEPSLCVELPTVTQMKLLEIRSLFPRQAFDKKIPPIVFLHQLYDKKPLTEAIANNEIEEMKRSGKIKPIISGSITGLILSEDLNEYFCTLDLDKKIGDQLRSIWKDDLMGCIHKLTLKTKYRLTDRDISDLIRSGFLIIQNETEYSFSFPGLGGFMKAFYAGRRAILTAIDRSKYKELLVSVGPGQRVRSSRLPKITRPRYPHLGYSQGSAQPQCNGGASPWRNRLVDHGNLHAR